MRTGGEQLEQFHLPHKSSHCSAGWTINDSPEKEVWHSWDPLICQGWSEFSLFAFMSWPLLSSVKAWRVCTASCVRAHAHTSFSVMTMYRRTVTAAESLLRLQTIWKEPASFLLYSLLLPWTRSGQRGSIHLRQIRKHVSCRSLLQHTFTSSGSDPSHQNHDPAEVTDNLLDVGCLLALHHISSTKCTI